MRKILLISAGFVCLALGVVGILVPLLPTTPLLILAAACFSRSSGSLSHWITHHRLFGEYIRCYQQFRAVSRKTKVLALILLWAFIGFSAVFVVSALWLRIGLLVIAVSVTVHILGLRTLTRDMVARLE